MADSIAAKPLLTGHVLKIANSPLFGLRVAIADVGQVIGVIGLCATLLLWLAYTAGLLHDIGMLVLPVGQGSAPDVRDPAAEASAYGVHHGAAGAAVCAAFALPATLTAAVRLHHAPAVVEMEDVPAEASDIHLALAVGLADPALPGELSRTMALLAASRA